MYKFLLASFFCFCSACAISQSVNFTYTSINGSFCTPATIQFTHSSTGSPVGFIWNFGNNTKSHTANPTTTYNKAGTYNVTLTVIYAAGTVKVVNTIVINPTVNPSFTSDKNVLCQPGNVNFSAVVNNNISSYDWDFGDGSPLTSTTSATISHFYTTYGTFPVTLKAKSISGCDSSSTATIIVQKIPIAGTVSALLGCIPATINFNATVSTPSNETISNVVWDYGDGGKLVTNFFPGSSLHLYNLTGRYLPTLAITTQSGCTSTFKFDSVAFGTPPTNLIAYTKKNVICGSETAVFVGKATNANSYVWNNNETIDVVTDTISTHKYKKLGQKTISVTPLFNGCEAAQDSFKINVIGVISNFTFTNRCTDKKTFSFINRSLGNLSSITWDFGDSTGKQNLSNIVHTFPGPGTYVVSLVVNDTITGCSDTLRRSVIVANPVLVNPDQFVCRNSITTFNVLNVYPNIVSKYAWYVIGKKPGQTTKSVLNIKADQFGTFDPIDNIVVIDNGSSYCPDTLQLNHKIIVKGPIANFTSKDSICLSTPLDVINNSRPYLPADNITLWDWNFGDNTTHDITSQPAAHQYSNPGNYTVTLTATDINGCTDIFKKKISVSEDAFVYTFPKTDTLCLGQPKTLIAFQDDSILWSPANLVSCATCDTTIVNPTNTTTFYATSTNAFGCTAKDSVLVKVYPPFTATTAASDLYICLNDTVQLNVAPAGYKVMWSPPNGLSDPNISSPMASPFVTTTYTATLSDSIACFTSNVDVIVHLNSQPTVDAGPDKFYPYNSSFTITPVYSNNIVSYLWTPSSQLNCTTCPAPSGIITQKGSYTIQVTSDSGCVAKDSITILIECKDANLLIPNAFTPNNDNLNDVFYPLTRGVSTITNFSIYNREGHLVFQKKNFPPNDRSFGWDGTFKGANISTAVFVYILEALCDSGERLSKRGIVTLIR